MLSLALNARMPHDLLTIENAKAYCERLTGAKPYKVEPGIEGGIWMLVCTFANFYVFEDYCITESTLTVWVEEGPEGNAFLYVEW